MFASLSHPPPAGPHRLPVAHPTAAEWGDLDEHTRWDGAGSAVVLLLAGSCWGLFAVAGGVWELFQGVVRRRGAQGDPPDDHDI